VLLNPISSACVHDGSLTDDVKLFRRLSMALVVRSRGAVTGLEGPDATAVLRC
jgi:hypothetical protein